MMKMCPCSTFWGEEGLIPPNPFSILEVIIHTLYSIFRQIPHCSIYHDTFDLLYYNGLLPKTCSPTISSILARLKISAKSETIQPDSLDLPALPALKLVATFFHTCKKIRKQVPGEARLTDGRLIYTAIVGRGLRE